MLACDVASITLGNASHYPIEEPGLTQMRDAMAAFIRSLPTRVPCWTIATMRPRRWTCPTDTLPVGAVPQFADPVEAA